MTTNTMTVSEALLQAEMIELCLDAMEKTAPKALATLGGRDALARKSEMSCIGPVPRLDEKTWERMSREYEDRRNGW